MCLFLIQRPKMVWLLAVLSLFLHTTLVYGEDKVLRLETGTRQMAVQGGIEYLVEEQPLDHYQVSAETYRAKWKKLTTKTVNFGILHRPTWFRFDVRNKAAKDLAWVMEIGWPLLDRVEVSQYNQTNGTWSLPKVGGNLLPVINPVEGDHHFLFPLNLPPGQLTTVYIRVETTGTLILTIDIMQEKAFWQHNQHHSILLGTFFGILAVMLLYNFSLYYFTSDKSYFYYSFYVFSIILYVLAHTGIGTQYVWDASNWIKQRGYPIFASLSFLSGTLFVRQFLYLKQYKGWVLQLNNIILAYWIFAALSYAFWTNAAAIATTEPMALFSCIAGFATGIYLWAKGNVSAKYYTIAWAFLIFGTFIYSLSSYGLIERTPFTQYTQMVGFALEVILLSYALAERINREKAQREEAQRVALDLSQKNSEERAAKLKAQEQILDMQRRANEELEQRVSDRTFELEDAIKAKEENLTQLQKTLDEIRTLRGIIPICSYCKNIRNDKGAWGQMEKYISDHSDAAFSHGVCPDCYKKVMAEEFD
jgi:two-component system, sensor histidine kinase LadS